MKKIIALLIVAVFVVGLIEVASAVSPSKIRSYINLLSRKLSVASKNKNWKRVAKLKKMIAFQRKRLAQAESTIAPPPPPVAVPPPPPRKMIVAKGEALFGWGVDACGSLGYVMNKAIIAGRADALLPDPLGLGPIVGLSAESVKYKVGLGGFTGKDTNDVDFRGITLNLDGLIMVPADVLGGIESYLGGGINYLVYRSGTLGGQIYYGIQGDLGLGLGGKSFAQLGYTIIRTGSGVDTPRSSKGLGLEFGHSLTL